MQPGTLAKEAGPQARRDNAIIGHRLAGGYMSVHAPGQPCGLCSGAPNIPASWRRIASTRAIVKE